MRISDWSSDVCSSDLRVSQIQILSHQAKIAMRMELFIGVGHDYSSATFKRLGYLSLDNNQRSDFQARELKSVYIDAPGSFLKLLIHRCYVNKFNMCNQVGVVDRKSQRLNSSH